MNKDEFRTLATEVIADILEDMEKEDISGTDALITRLSMTMFAAKLSDRLFDNCDSNEFEEDV